MPEIAGHFQTTAVGWVITLVTLVLAATTPIMGKLGDIYGKKLVMLSASAVFAVGCLIAAVAPSFELFLVGRGLQGAGMGILVLAYGLIRDVLPRELVPVAVGFIATGMGASTILGPVIGGYLIDHFGYASVFWAQLAHVTVAGVLVALLVPESTLRTKSRLDVVGALILAVGAFVLLFGIGKASTWGFADVRTLGTVLGGAAILAAWLLYERRPAEPLVDLELLLHRPVAKTLTASALVQFVLISHSMLIPMFVMTDRSLDLGYGFGRTALGVALFTIPTGIASMIAGPVGGYLSRRTGPALVLVAGAGALAVGSAMLAFMHDTTGQLIAGQIVMGLGLGAASSALPNLIMGTVPATSQGIAAACSTCSGRWAARSAASWPSRSSPSQACWWPPSKMPMYLETGYVYAFGALAVAGALAAVVGLSLHTNRTQSAPGSSALVDEPAQPVAIGHSPRWARGRLARAHGVRPAPSERVRRRNRDILDNSRIRPGGLANVTADAAAVRRHLTGGRASRTAAPNERSTMSVRSSALNLADIFEAVVDAMPDREVLVCRRPAPHPRRARRACRTVSAHHLIAAGVRPGDHVGMHMRNSVEYVETLLAVEDPGRPGQRQLPVHRRRAALPLRQRGADGRHRRRGVRRPDRGRGPGLPDPAARAGRSGSPPRHPPPGWPPWSRPSPTTGATSTPLPEQGFPESQQRRPVHHLHRRHHRHAQGRDVAAGGLLPVRPGGRQPSGDGTTRSVAVAGTRQERRHLAELPAHRAADARRGECTRCSSACFMGATRRC